MNSRLPTFSPLNVDYPGPAHTYGDILLYLTKESVLFSGDVAFHYLTPLARDGHISDSIKIADGIYRVKIRTANTRNVLFLKLYRCNFQDSF